MGNFFLFLVLILIIGVLPLSVYLLRSLRESTNGTGPLDEDLTRTGEGAEAIEWWEARRSTFNRSLLASGAVVRASKSRLASGGPRDNARRACPGVAGAHRR